MVFKLFAVLDYCFKDFGLSMVLLSLLQLWIGYWPARKGVIFAEENRKFWRRGKESFNRSKLLSKLYLRI